MKGLYLYGVCPSLGARKISGIKGIDGAGKIDVLPYKDIAAILSEVPLEEFGSKEIQRRAREDLAWIKDKAVSHEKIIETVMKNFGVPIIPMKFGTIFKSKKGLLSSLGSNRSRFKELLEKLGGKEEWAVKTYLNTAVLIDEIKKTSPTIQTKLKEKNSLPAGKDYFLEKEAEELARAEVQKATSGYRLLFLDALGELTEEAKENKILDKALTGKGEPMVFNGAFLVKKEKVGKFLGQIQKLRAKFGEVGFMFDATGPWPPYSFV